MPDREDRPEIQEDTQRLVDELGRRLAEETTGSDAGIRARMARSAHGYGVDPDWILEDKLRDLGMEIERARLELRRLEEMHEYLAGRLRGERSPVATPAGRPAPYARPETPEYLEPVLSTILRERRGAFWLYGEDARERRRSTESLIASLEADSRPPFTVAVVDFTRAGTRRPRSRPGRGAEIAYIIRAAWESWEGGPGRAGPLAGSFDPRRHMGLTAALVLLEFPSRRRQARPFLAWLRREIALGPPAVIVVSTEAPPLQGSGLEAVLCEGRAALIGRRLSTLRLQKRWNRAHLARAAAVPHAELALIEAGIGGEVHGGVLGRLAGALGVTRQELERPDMTPQSPPSP
jgi:hypothetical protein